MKARQFWITLFTGTILAMASMAALAQDRAVNCDVGQSLQDAVNHARSSAAPLVLTVKGTCYETVRTGRDLIIEGNNEAVIHGSLVNFGGRWTVRNIDITGPGLGMFASTGRTRLLNVRFFDNEEAGLLISDNGMVAFAGGSVTNNGGAGVAVHSGNFEAGDVEISGNSSGIQASMAQITLENARVVDNSERGIDVAENSALRLVDSIVSGNGGVGVIADNSSSFVAERVDISRNGSSAVGLRWNSTAEIVASTISYNGQGGGFGSGVFVSMSSSAIIESTEIFSNRAGVNANRKSIVDIRGTTVVRDNLEHGIGLDFDSGAILYPPVSIPPNGSGYAVYCFDTESILDNRSAGVGLTDCRDRPW
jgi:hypothetical protein